MPESPDFDPKATMKVWLVWTGDYSAASVVGVYSTRELAEAAAKMHGAAFGSKPEGWVDDAAGEGYTVDADAPMVRAGVSRWRIDIGVDDGAVTWIYQMHVGTGEPPRVGRTGSKLAIECDARDKDHAVKIAGDERRKYRVTHDAVAEGTDL